MTWVSSWRRDARAGAALRLTPHALTLVEQVAVLRSRIAPPVAVDPRVTRVEKVSLIRSVVEQVNEALPAASLLPKGARIGRDEMIPGPRPGRVDVDRYIPVDDGPGYPGPVYRPRGDVMGPRRVKVPRPPAQEPVGGWGVMVASPALAIAPAVQGLVRLSPWALRQLLRVLRGRGPGAVARSAALAYAVVAAMRFASHRGEPWLPSWDGFPEGYIVGWNYRPPRTNVVGSWVSYPTVKPDDFPGVLDFSNITQAQVDALTAIQLPYDMTGWLSREFQHYHDGSGGDLVVGGDAWVAHGMAVRKDGATKQIIMPARPALPRSYAEPVRVPLPQVYFPPLVNVLPWSGWNVKDRASELAESSVRSYAPIPQEKPARPVPPLVVWVPEIKLRVELTRSTRVEARAPGIGVKELKIRATAHAERIVDLVWGGLTEALDLQRVLYDALPERLRRAWEARHGKGVNSRWRALAAHWSQISVDDAAWGLLKNHVEDFVVALQAGVNVAANRAAGAPVGGFGTGAVDRDLGLPDFDILIDDLRKVVEPVLSASLPMPGVSKVRRQ